MYQIIFFLLGPVSLGLLFNIDMLVVCGSGG
jgi:hypothetical protein